MPPARTTTVPRATAPRAATAPRRATASGSRAQQARARSAQTAPRRVRRKPRPSAWARVRWDRIGRIALLIVLVVVAGLYLQHTVEFFVARSSADAQRAIVYKLARRNAALRVQRQALQQPDTIERYARALGMVKSGERPYVMLGLTSSAATLARRHGRH